MGENCESGGNGHSHNDESGGEDGEHEHSHGGDGHSHEASEASDSASHEHSQAPPQMGGNQQMANAASANKPLAVVKVFHEAHPLVFAKCEKGRMNIRVNIKTDRGP